MNEARTRILLIECLKKESEERRGRLFRLIREGVDLQELSRMACYHGVASRVYNVLKFYTPTSDEEKKGMRALQIAALANATANSYYKEELVRVLKFFITNGVPAIPLKGITLSFRLYGDIVSRDQSADLDLLVKEQDKERARLLLEDLGYSFVRVREIPERSWYYMFVKPREKMVELHWDITMMGRTPERIKGLWQGAEVAAWEGMQYYDFKPEELLLYLSAHFVNSDGVRKIKYVGDINRVLEKYWPDIWWESLARKAVYWRLNGSLYAGLVIARDMLGAQVPDRVLGELRLDPLKRFFIRSFVNRRVMFEGGIRRKVLDLFLNYIFFELVEARSIKGHVNIWKRVLLPSKGSIDGRGHVLRLRNGILRFIRTILSRHR